MTRALQPLLPLLLVGAMIFLASGQAPIPFDELLAGMQMVFAAKRSLASGRPVDLDALAVSEPASA